MPHHFIYPVAILFLCTVFAVAKEGLFALNVFLNWRNIAALIASFLVTGIAFELGFISRIPAGEPLAGRFRGAGVVFFMFLPSLAAAAVLFSFAPVKDRSAGQLTEGVLREFGWSVLALLLGFLLIAYAL